MSLLWRSRYAAEFEEFAEELSWIFPGCMEIEEGQITGLIGANGAGKSTTFKVILGLVHPDAGEIRLFNKDMEQISQKEKADIGATLSDSGFSNCLTVKQIVHILTETYEKFDREMFEKRCSLFSIPMDKKLKEFSTGMKAKLKVLTATSFDARLLVLDEPTAGLDPRGRDEVLDQVSALQKSRGITVILVSHSMEDVAKYVDRLIVMNQGEVRFDGRPVEVFHHYKELEEIGLAAPQTTYLMQELKKQGADVNTDATTVEEAADAIEAWLKASK